MNENLILDGIQQSIRDILDNPDLIISPSTTAKDVAGWDSLNHINILSAIESVFGIKFTIIEMSTFTNVENIIIVINKKIIRN